MGARARVLSGWGHKASAVLACLGVLASACAPTPASPPPGSSLNASNGAAPGISVNQPPRPPKILTVAAPQEPAQLEGFLGAGSIGGAGEIRNIVHAFLAVLTEDESYQAQLAVELPSTDRGTWQINADGSMDTIWKLRPGVKWHDGTPFTSEDLLFAYQLRKDPNLPPPGAANIVALWESASAPDLLTFQIHWSAAYYGADRAEVLGPLPRHLLQEAHARGDAESFVINPYFTSEFVGLGPFKLTSWAQGSEMQFSRFDDFFLGRPILDGMIVRFIPDSNAMVASILAEAVDLILARGITLDTGMEVRQRWEGTGNLVKIERDGRYRILEPQMRPEVARPRAGLTDVRVRQALSFAIDRQSLIDVTKRGLAPISDSWLPPEDPRRRELEEDIPKFPYDVRRAQQLLAEAGWAPGSDGILVHSGTGEKFELSIRATQVAGGQVGKDTEAQLLANDYKQIGIASTVDLQAIGTATSRQYDATRPGMLVSGALVNTFNGRYESRYIASDANRWGGSNLAGYSDPEADTLLVRFVSTIDQRERTIIERGLLRKLIGEVALYPLLWEVVPVLMLKSVNPVAGVRTTYKFYAWDKA